jgi:hypothetical protein
MCLAERPARKTAEEGLHLKSVIRAWRLGLAVVVSTMLIGVGNAASAGTSTDWSAYLDGPAHSSFNAADTAITPGKATTLVQKWKFRGIRQQCLASRGRRCFPARP